MRVGGLTTSCGLAAIYSWPAVRSPQSTAARRSVVSLIHACVTELGFAHHAIPGMRAAHVRQIAVVVGDTENRAHVGRSARKHTRDASDHRLVVRVGR